MQNDKSAALILVVDDQADMLHMMKLMLERSGYRVEIARSAQQALLIAPEKCPDIIVSDIGMPGMDGCEMMSILRRQHGPRAFKSIALTGYGLPCDQDRISESGFDLCLLKPVEFPALVEHIEQMLRSQSDAPLESLPFHHAAFSDATSEIPLQMAAEH